LEGKLNHPGVGNAPARSTLSYANAHRPCALFEELFFQLLGRCKAIAAPIDLCLSIFDWAKFRRTKGAIKLHLLLDHDGCLSCNGVLTDGKTHEIRVARTPQWPPGSIVVMDRGYVDYRFLDSLEDQGVFFVTRLKERALFSVEAEVSAPKANIRADEMICLPGSGKNTKALRLFHRVVVWDEAGEREIVLLTNNMKLAASTIAAIYKSRWQIELFFRALKQNLKIKTFVGTSPNAVRIQIWTALIAILLLKFLQMRSRLVRSSCVIQESLLNDCKKGNVLDRN